MPRTDAFLKENLESREEWQKRKIIWAIKLLQTKTETPSPYKVLATASISAESIDILSPFIGEQLCKSLYDTKTDLNKGEL